MPYKSEKIKLPENLDRRRKLNDAQKSEIMERAKRGESQRTLAKEFGVSRRLIGIVASPEQKAAVERRIKEHWRDYRPRNSEWAKIMREHRRYKHKLYLDGELKDRLK